MAHVGKKGGLGLARLLRDIKGLLQGPAPFLHLLHVLHFPFQGFLQMVPVRFLLVLDDEAVDDAGSYHIAHGIKGELGGHELQGDEDDHRHAEEPDRKVVHPGLLPCVLVLPARTENLTAFQDFADERLGEDCPFRTKMQIELVVEEIFINIASYAYAPGEGDAAMQVERSEDPAAVTITFRDRGVPYDPLQREDPDVNAMAEARQIGGLGIFLTKQLMDEVRYEYTGGQNVLTMKKLLERDETSAQ